MTKTNTRSKELQLKSINCGALTTLGSRRVHRPPPPEHTTHQVDICCPGDLPSSSSSQQCIGHPPVNGIRLGYLMVLLGQKSNNTFLVELSKLKTRNRWYDVDHHNRKHRWLGRPLILGKGKIALRYVEGKIGGNPGVRSWLTVVQNYLKNKNQGLIYISLLRQAAVQETAFDEIYYRYHYCLTAVGEVPGVHKRICFTDTDLCHNIPSPACEPTEATYRRLLAKQDLVFSEKFPALRTIFEPAAPWKPKMNWGSVRWARVKMSPIVGSPLINSGLNVKVLFFIMNQITLTL